MLPFWSNVPQALGEPDRAPTSPGWLVLKFAAGPASPETAIDGALSLRVA